VVRRNGGKKHAKKMTKSGSMMVEDMLRSKKRVGELIYRCWRKNKNCAVSEEIKKRGVGEGRKREGLKVKRICTVQMGTGNFSKLLVNFHFFTRILMLNTEGIITINL
jgi:hypothetical protein